MMKTWATAAIICLITFGCKKSDQSQTDCGSYGGLVEGRTYLFWMTKDLGQLKVEVKDQNGNTQTALYTDVIKVYYPNTTPLACDDSQLDKNANPLFSLRPGRAYTYRAYNSNYNFTGTISVACDQTKCNNIQVK